MPLASPILGAARPRDNVHFAKYAQNFADRAARRLPGVGWLVLGTVASAVLMVVVGGLGTSAMPIGMRAAFWALLMGWNAIKWQTWFALLVRRESHWWHAAAGGALLLNLSLPLEIRAALLLCGADSEMAPATTIWSEALAISGLVCMVLIVVTQRIHGRRSAPPQPAIRPDGLLARAGLSCPTALLAIIAEDHYCRLHLRDGSSVLIHHRFGDALDEVAGLDGLRVHRGAWAADAAVIAARRDRRRWLLELTDGPRISVSAPYLAAVRARGWLRRRA